MNLIEAALKEDMPHGDITTDSLALGPRFGYARLIAKQDLILSGAREFEETVLTLDPTAKLKWHFNDGDNVMNKQVVCTITSDLIQLLKAERVALNFIGHLSGIATLTRQYVDQIKHTSTQITDNRKHLPGYRDLELRAVRHGQGLNHRFNLSESVLLNGNHIVVARGITPAVERIRAHSQLPIAVEASSLDEVKEAISAGVDRILLRHMSNEEIRDALELIPEGIQTQASGQMTVERVRIVAELGIDFISVGALTHSAPRAELVLLFDWQTSKGS